MRDPGLVKRGQRYDVTFSCSLVDGEGREIAVRIEDISKQGCRIRSDEMLRIGDRVMLRLGSQGDRMAKIRWALGDEAGAAFEEPLDLAD